MITLYRAHPEPGVDSLDGIRSWTTSRSHAMRYVTGEFEGYGGPHLYVTEVKASLIVDLRPCEEYEKLRSVVIDLVGFDLNDLPIDLGYYHDLFREVAPIARARGFQWLAFCDEYPFSNVEEWLYLGSDPLPVREIETD